ncbi:uncharacterized protein FIBRA_05077 [Fibroporia radiculosa]|uniref:Sld7 C-terminal domain-containing protein n=1 Tax=Fibroporia radiculosa TaxID=599839 RepID=J4HWX0_9APHY|nr:uncharacterized protein FIBRA_05077 [Fibroporia radiculosa]CCM02962.1 predicted protein [Fibroporia radiculosa]
MEINALQHKPHNTSTHRLLYRGALSLPDSHMLLDGLSFTVSSHTGESSSTTYGVDLLNNPLTLALESMRGRNLHFLGTASLSEVWIDAKSDGVVSVDIHPQAALSRMYFEALFCLEGSMTLDGKSEYGMRVSLSDSDDSDASDILIYAQLPPNGPVPAYGALDLPSTSTSAPNSLRLIAARILPGPPPAPAPPRPRPDDPTPRLPPSASKRKRDQSPSDERKRTKSGRESSSKTKGKALEISEDAETLRLARETMRRLPKPGTSVSRIAGGRTASRTKDSKEFKIPKVPHRTSKADVKAHGEGFGSSSSQPLEDPEEQGKANKLVIKQATVLCLADYSIAKENPEYKAIYNAIYQGVCFAMRAQMRTAPVNTWMVYRLVDSHAKMYVQVDE